MKKWLSYYQSYMVRPILYKVVARSAIAVAVLLLWNRYVNTGGQLSLGRDGCFVVGVLFLAFAELSEREQALCSLTASLICAVIFVVVSVLF